MTFARPHRRRTILPPALVLLAAALAATVAFAQAWKAKPPEKWSQKDAKKILSDSPWARQAMMPYHPLTEYGGRAPRVTDPQIRVGQIPLDETDPSSVSARPPWTVNIIWSSSRTVRRAVALDQSGGSYKPDREHDAPRQMYEITALTATTTWPLPDWSEGEIRAGAYLKFGASGPEVRPERVKVVYFPGTHRVESYWFAFPREDAEGMPYLRDGTQEVHFYCQLGPVAMRAKFEPAKMVAHDGPDL